MSLRLCFTIWAVVAFVAPSLARADGILKIPIEQVVSELEIKLKGKSIENCGDQPALPPFKFEKDLFPWDLSRFCHPFNVENFCAVVQSKCTNSHGTPTCMLYQLPAPDGRPYRKRDSDDYRLQVFKKTQDVFDGALSDIAFVDQCCKHDRDCEIHLKKTRLLVLRGLPELDNTTVFDPEEFVVKVSEGFLLDSQNQEGIERQLWHELGHACQASHHQNWTASFALHDFFCGFSPKLYTDRQDLRMLLGDDVSKCVMTSLEAENARPDKSGNQTGCLTNWAEEAYANSVYIQKLTDLAHWATACYPTRDEEHAPVTSYMGCFFKNSSLLENYCGKS
jgi:hypothetical protein